MAEILNNNLAVLVKNSDKGPALVGGTARRLDSQAQLMLEISISDVHDNRFGEARRGSLVPVSPSEDTGHILLGDEVEIDAKALEIIRAGRQNLFITLNPSNTKIMSLRAMPAVTDDQVGIHFYYIEETEWGSSATGSFDGHMGHFAYDHPYNLAASLKNKPKVIMNAIMEYTQRGEWRRAADLARYLVAQQPDIVESINTIYGTEGVSLLLETPLDELQAPSASRRKP